MLNVLYLFWRENSNNYCSLRSPCFKIESCLFHFFRNPYLTRAYGGTWFRSNFQDLFSNRGAQKLEWFEVIDGNDCAPVPATVNAGRPPSDICKEAAVDERRCICINTGRSSSETGYEGICGNCRDPCQLKFTPDRVPKYLQKLAVLDKDEEDDYEEYEDDYEK